MRFFKSIFWLSIILVVSIGCQRIATFPESNTSSEIKEATLTGFDRGIKKSDILQLTSYLYDSADQFELEIEKNAISKVLNTQSKHLRFSLFRNKHLNDSVSITQKDLKNTNEILKNLTTNDQNAFDSLIRSNFDLYRLSGDDSLGNVLFTGYFTPVMKVRSVKDSIYKYPFYKYPSRKSGYQLPDRREIDFQNALSGKGLEIAWSDNLFDNFTLQVQGSGIVEFEDQSKKILAYGGKNGHPYSSIGKHLIELGEITKENISLSAIRDWLSLHPERVREVLSINKSYVFFKLLEPTPIGAASVPLTADYSAAVDTDIIPLGSTLLAEVPVLDGNGLLIRHDYRLLFAQDRGGAIKGTGRIDLYCGIGETGIKKANSLNHYGRVWLLKPK